MRFYSVLILFTAFLFPCITVAQSVNAKDSLGRKHGFWLIRGADKKSKSHCDTCLMEAGSYMEGKKTGVWKQYYPNHALQSVIEYKNGRPNGNFTSYLPTGCLDEEGRWERTNYKDTLKIYSKHPDSCGVLVKTRFFDGQSQMRVKGTTSHTRVNDGQIIYHSGLDTIPPARDIKDGYHKFFETNKRLSMDGEFKNGRLYNGKWYRYDKNGLIESVRIYKEGKYVGDAEME